LVQPEEDRHEFEVAAEMIGFLFNFGDIEPILIGFIFLGKNLGRENQAKIKENCGDIGIIFPLHRKDSILAIKGRVKTSSLKSFFFSLAKTITDL